VVTVLHSIMVFSAFDALGRRALMMGKLAVELAGTDCGLTTHKAVALWGLDRNECGAMRRSLREGGTRM
jgi:hypothetical protein